MRSRTILTGTLAVICGLSSAVGVNHFSAPRQAAPPVETAPVLVAVADIPRGNQLLPDMVRVSQWPKELVPEGTLTSLDDIEDRTVLVAMSRGEPLLKTKMTEGRGGIGPLIPRGMRAFTIQTSHVASNLAGFVLPGDRVDVLFTTGAVGRDDTTGGGSTTTLLQNIEVLAVQQHLEAPPENKSDPRQIRSVTLLARPDQVTKLDLAQNKGQLHLSLRNPEDGSEGYTRPATLRELRFDQEGPSPINALAELFSNLKPVQPVAEPEPAAPEPESESTPEPRQSVRLKLRTLRGVIDGEVVMERT